MELNIQKLLRCEADAQDQISALGIRANAHPVYPNLKQFVYNMIDSYPFKNHPVVCESRGLILDSDQNWAVVAHPFHRFFNLGETGAADIDWSTARVQEKLDGSLITMWHYAGVWHLSTRKIPGANTAVGDWGISFADLFWRCWNSQYGDGGFQWLTPGATYCWELTSPLNRVVTLNTQERITLLAVRDADGQELDVRQFSDRFDVVRHFDLGSAQLVTEAAELLDPMSQEGYVVVDYQFRRVKIKGSQYVAIHHTVTSMNTRSIVELIQRGEADEVMTYFPEIQLEFTRILEHIRAEAQAIDHWYQQLKPWTQQVIFNGDRVAESQSRKQFAEAMMHLVPKRYHAAMFALVKNQAVSGQDWILKQNAEFILRWMEFKSLRKYQPTEE